MGSNPTPGIEIHHSAPARMPGSVWNVGGARVMRAPVEMVVDNFGRLVVVNSDGSVFRLEEVHKKGSRWEELPPRGTVAAGEKSSEPRGPAT